MIKNIASRIEINISCSKLEEKSKIPGLTVTIIIIGAIISRFAEKNIKINIPKKICIENKMKIKWKFKNEYTENILELKIKNKEIEEINNFKYII